jgi:hypothetical protein
MPDDRTMVTELGTALGTLPYPDPTAALASRPCQLHIDGHTWDRFGSVHAAGRFAAELTRSFANGRALLEAPDGLRGRAPRTVEWTGGRRPPGDEVAPIDLRIDHVYLVSCKYESDILANVSPGRLFDGLLATTGGWDRGDWYQTVAPDELIELYQACLAATGQSSLPPEPGQCNRDELATLRAALSGRTYPDERSRAAYSRLCTAVSTASARRWTEQLAASGTASEAMLWRLLRIGSAPYFVLGHDRRRGLPARFRIASPWDWREEFELVGFAVSPATAGQPRVDWAGSCRSRRDGRSMTVSGHVEIRWSHGRFAQPPEAKVYLDTPMSCLPGYHPLDPVGEAQPTLWATTP